MRGRKYYLNIPLGVHFSFITGLPPNVSSLHLAEGAGETHVHPSLPFLVYHHDFSRSSRIIPISFLKKISRYYKFASFSDREDFGTVGCGDNLCSKEI